MPLWGRMLYQPRANERKKFRKSQKFKIPFTEEVFDSEKEYKEQLALYQQPLWTCQSSRDSGLTYEEARASELHYRNEIQENISLPLQKTILQMVHHSNGSLEFLVDRIEEEFNNQFHVGEVVELAKCKGKIIKGKVLQVRSQPNQTCNGSPSSDKENHIVEPELLRKSKSNKIRPLYYNVQIGGKTGKVISSVPASDLIRCEDLPPADLITLLIRSNALQAGIKSNSTWIVTADVVNALDIRNKLIETLLPSTRISISGLKGAAKRKPANPDAQPTKKAKLKNGSNTTPLNGERTPTKADSNTIMIVDTDSEDARLSPSPEKVFLDHSYSSPQSKSRVASASPTSEETHSSITPQSDKQSSKVVTKEGVLRALGSVKSEGSKRTSKISKKTKGEQREKDKSFKKKRKIEREVQMVNDSSDSSDSDVFLKALSIKLTPIKQGKPPSPVRRTLADHFLSMSKKKKIHETINRTEEVSEKTVAKTTAGKRKSSKSFREDGVPKRKDRRIGINEGMKKTKDLYHLTDSPTKITKNNGSKLKQKYIAEVQKGSPKVVKKEQTLEMRRVFQISPIKVSDMEGGESVMPSKSASTFSPKKRFIIPLKKSPSKKLTSLASLAKSLKSSPNKKYNDAARKSSESPSKISRTPIKSPMKGSSQNKSLKISPKKILGSKKMAVKQKNLTLKTSKSKSLKQVTLFNYPSKKKQQPEYNSSDDDALILYKIAKPIPPIAPREPPPIAAKMMKAKRANIPSTYSRLVGQAAKTLTMKQISLLKPLIQGDVIARAQLFEARTKWRNMTPEERKKLMETKRREKQKKQNENRMKKLLEVKEKAKRYEDQLLNLTPLILPKPVSLPEGLPNALFGDIAMVIEFLNGYSGFLMPDDPYPVTTDSFMKALVCDKEGFSYLSRILVILLKTLLQDQITEDFIELGMKLSDIPVNMHTASELLRLSLMQTDSDPVEANDSESDTSFVNQEEGEFTAPQDLVELLEMSEFFSLSPEVKLELMVCVCNRILSTYSLVDYMEDQQRKAAKLWCQKMHTLKLKNDVIREDKKKLREEREATQKQKKEEEEKKKTEQDKTGIKPEGEDKKPDKEAVKKETKEVEEKPPPAVEEEEKPPPPVEEEPEDLASIVKRRRFLTAKAKVDQEEQTKKDLERRLRGQEEMKVQKEKVNFEKNLTEGIQLSKTVLRHLPIGTDRNHNRYWVFSTVTPGLFIEKGWACRDIEYRHTPSQNDESDAKDEGGVQEISQMESGVEHSCPRVGQNLWFQYDTVKELDTLLEGLNNAGIRESDLLRALKKRYNDITRNVHQSRRSGQMLRDSDGPKELLDSFKEDLKDIETHIREGSLGGVSNFDKWEKKLDAASSLKGLAQLMTESQECVNPKFLESIMAPPRKRILDPWKEEENENKKVTEKVLKWQEAVKGSVTMSRLHVLLSVFEVCVKWEKSSANSKCKICRRKKSPYNNQIILCDECNEPFHLFCLRPVLSSIPSKEWKCPSCAPLPERSGRKRNYKEVDEIETDEESQEEEEDEEESQNENEESEDEYGNEEAEENVCCVCEMGEETITCSKCGSAYHKDCHEPPMRNFPRGDWTCYSCLHSRFKRTTRNVVKSKKRGKYRRR